MDFLQVIEAIRAEDATVQKLFSGEGQSVRASRRMPGPDYSGRLVEAAEFVADVYEGRRPVHHLQEALSTSDFPLLFGDVLDRQVLAAYTSWPVAWANYIGSKSLRDFRPTKLIPPPYGADTRLAAVAQLTEYPETSLTENSHISLTVKKYGRRMSFAWETLVNDDLDQLKDTPDRFGKAARRTEERAATELFVDANGPHASLYTSGNKNIINQANGGSVDNPHLSIAALQDAFIVLSKMVDEQGEPIMVETVELVVPPALEVVALNILNALQLSINTNGGIITGLTNTLGEEQRLIVQNWMKSRLRLNINPYIPAIATTNGNTSWFLFGNPAVGRPAAVLTFLRGHETPEVFMKEPDARRVGGGSSDVMNGDFDTDAITYKVRHVLGSSIVEPKMTVASKGTDT